MSEKTRPIKIIRTEYETCLDDAEDAIRRSEYETGWRHEYEIRSALRAIIQAMRSESRHVQH